MWGLGVVIPSPFLSTKLLTFTLGFYFDKSKQEPVRAQWVPCFPQARGQIRYVGCFARKCIIRSGNKSLYMSLVSLRGGVPQYRDCLKALLTALGRQSCSWVRFNPIQSLLVLSKGEKLYTQKSLFSAFAYFYKSGEGAPQWGRGTSSTSKPQAPNDRTGRDHLLLFLRQKEPSVFSPSLLLAGGLFITKNAIWGCPLFCFCCLTTRRVKKKRS